MSKKLLVSLGTMGLCALGAASPLDAQAQDGRASYTLYNLGTLGGSVSSGNTINDLGWVIGNANLPGDEVTHAAVWIDGMKFDLGTLGGANSVVDWPVHNERGVISGFAETADIDSLMENWSCSAFFPSATHHVCLGFRYFEGTMTKLPTLGGTANGYAARASITGARSSAGPRTPCTTPAAILPRCCSSRPSRGARRMRSARCRPIPETWTVPRTAVNDEGDIVGISGTCDNAVGAASAAHALIWHHGQPLLIPTFGGKGWNTPADINGRGQVVGFADIPGDVVDGVLTPFPCCHTASSGVRGQGRGKFCRCRATRTPLRTPSTMRARSSVNPSVDRRDRARSSGRTAGPTDLNALVPPRSPLYLVYAEGINNRGEITGQGCVLVDGACPTTGAVTPAFLAVPDVRWGGWASGDALNEAAATASAPAVRVSPQIYRQALRRFGVRQP